MSVHDTSVDADSSPETPGPLTESSPMRRCASYLGCRHCEEGALVYDADVGASRCRSCGKLD